MYDYPVYGDEQFEDLVMDSIQEYVGQLLIDEEGNPYKITSIERRGFSQVEYWLEGMPIPWVEDMHKLNAEVSKAYVKGQSRRYMIEEKND